MTSPSRSQATPRPSVSLALIEHLRKHFPDQAPRLGTTFERIWYDAGASAVVKYLERVHADQASQSLTANSTTATP